MTSKIKELLDQAIILRNRKETIDIAEYLTANNVVWFPVKKNDKVYFLVAKGQFGSLLCNGVVVERNVDEIAWDGEKIKIISYRENENDSCGNLYAYLGELVFVRKEEAECALEDLKKCELQRNL